MHHTSITDPSHIYHTSITHPSLILHALNSEQDNKLKVEHEQLTEQIADLAQVMQDDTRVLGILKQETREIRAKHAVPRRSALWEEEAELTEQDFLANDRLVNISATTTVTIAVTATTATATTATATATDAATTAHLLFS